MKLEARRVEGFLDAPGACRAVLLFGEDVGMIRERSNRLVRAVAGGLDDPFRVAELERDGLPRLAEEMGSRALTGGRRVVRVRDITDAATAAVTAALDRGGEALLVLEAPGLPARAKLRTALERLPDAVAIGCYKLEGSALEQAIGTTLSGLGVSVTPEALEWLTAHLGADLVITRSELEKLALYVGSGGRVDLAAAEHCVGDLAGLSMDDALFAATAGDVAETDRALELAMAEGTAAVALLRATLGHLQKLQRARAAMAQGASASEAAKTVRPPLFFRREPAFVQALRLWPEPALEAAATRVWEAERACKRTGTPAETICRSVLLGLAQRAAQQRRR
jgi:DNA polymerase-3 subunit delta